MTDKDCRTCGYGELVICGDGSNPQVQCFNLKAEAFRRGLVPAASFCEDGWRPRDPKQVRRMIAPEVRKATA